MELIQLWKYCDLGSFRTHASIQRMLLHRMTFSNWPTSLRRKVFEHFVWEARATRPNCPSTLHPVNFWQFDCQGRISPWINQYPVARINGHYWLRYLSGERCDGSVIPIPAVRVTRRSKWSLSGRRDNFGTKRICITAMRQNKSTCFSSRRSDKRSR